MVDADFKEPGEGGTPSRGNLTTIVIIAVIAFVIGVGGGFVALKILLDGDKNNTAAQTANVKVGGDTANKAGDRAGGDTSGKSGGDTSQTENKAKQGFLSLETFTVNLNDPFGRRYVECDLNLVLDDRDMVPRIKENALVMAKIRHEIFMTVSAKSYSDLKSTAGKITLFEEIQMRVNEILKEQMSVEPVIEVLQTKFLMQ